MNLLMIIFAILLKLLCPPRQHLHTSILVIFLTSTYITKQKTQKALLPTRNCNNMKNENIDMRYVLRFNGNRFVSGTCRGEFRCVVREVHLGQWFFRIHTMKWHKT